MSSPCHTLSPHEVLLAKTMDAHQHTEAEWHLISKGEFNPVSSDDEYMAEMQERKVEEECKAQEEAVRVKEEAKKIAKEAAEREVVAKRAAEATEERADTKQRALKEQLWKMAGCRASGVQDPCTWCHNKGTPCVLGVAKGKTMACKVCCHAKVSCSWTRKSTGEAWKRKWVQHSEEVEDMEVIEVSEKDEEEEVWSHFSVPTHLTEEHQDALGVLMTMLDTLSMDFLEFCLKEEEMRKNKGKGKEKAQEEFRRARTEDDDRDMEMGGAGPSSLV
ncbi:hypothetical protein ID866_11027 [Astraeus odoratus]|nr:hypothetical protein ID866_11027 [Astraeus odoratus]